MPDDKKVEIWDVQEWVRTAHLDKVREFLGFARAVVDMRSEYEAAATEPARTRKKRSDAGKSRTSETKGAAQG